MNIVILATLVSSSIGATVAYTVTHNRFLTALLFAFAPLLSLSLSLCRFLLGFGPEPFLPTGIAGAMVLFPFILWGWVRYNYASDSETRTSGDGDG